MKNNQAAVSNKYAIPRIRLRIRKFAKYTHQPSDKGHLESRLVGRTIQHVEPWSVFKVSLIFYLCLWVVFLIVGAILWAIAVSANLIERLENFMADLLALESYDLPFDRIYLIYAVGGLAGVFVLTAFTVLMCVIFNQINSIFGGVRMLVLEEESLRRERGDTDDTNQRKEN